MFEELGYRHNVKEPIYKPDGSARHDAEHRPRGQRHAQPIAYGKHRTKHGCKNYGRTMQQFSGGRAKCRKCNTERDTDFAPRGRNKGTTVVHADVGKFTLLWHSDEFKPIYIKERLLANPFFSPKKPYISVRTGTHQGLSKQPNMIFEEFALRRCIKNPFLTNMSLVSLAKAKVVIFYVPPNNSS